MKSIKTLAPPDTLCCPSLAPSPRMVSPRVLSSWERTHGSSKQLRLTKRAHPSTGGMHSFPAPKAFCISSLDQKITWWSYSVRLPLLDDLDREFGDRRVCGLYLLPQLLKRSLCCAVKCMSVCRRLSNPCDSYALNLSFKTRFSHFERFHPHIS